MVSANFVIPYPPGFPIMVPGQVMTQETIDFMRKLDVKEIHGYERARGLKLLRQAAAKARSRLRLTDRPRAAPGQPRSGIGPGVTTMQAFFQFLAANPYILLFLTVGLAVWIGRQSIAGYGLGMVAAAIIVGCGLSVWASTYGDEAGAEQLHRLAVLLPVHVRGRAAGRPVLRQQPGWGRAQVHASSPW